ncbi:PLC-like phosphodiesterase [Hyaloraphidium curvatum]|nr:PLC-like phosphodiesterase [Hyaloraphidium curvatum]
MTGDEENNPGRMGRVTPHPEDVDADLGIDPGLIAGMRLEKVDRSGSTLSRLVQLDVRRRCIVVESKKGLLRGITNREPVKFIEIKDIKELRPGLNTKELTQINRPAFEVEDRAFSIIYTRRGQYKVLNLIAPSPSVASTWITGLLKLGAGQDPVHRKDAFLLAMWNAADVDRNGRLSVAEAARLFEQFNIHKSRAELEDMLRSAGGGPDSHLDFDGLKRLYNMVARRPDVDRLFQMACEKASVLDFAHFRKFLLDAQKMDLPEDEVRLLYSEWADESGIGRESFGNFLLSPGGSIFDPGHRGVFQDMKRPLYEYWINSSHNTYLLGDQLRSSSSVEAYIRALQRGCRCVEIDTWDGPNGLPVVTHGHTLTSKIPLRDVLNAIAKYAFVASPYPVILSFEQHCSLEQQRVVARMLVEVFGDMLVTEALDVDGCPSPEDLMNRIIVKHKKASIQSRSSATLRTSRSVSPGGDRRSSSTATIAAYSPELFGGVEATTPTESSLLALLSDSESENELASDEYVMHAGKRKKLKPTAKELSDLVVYCVPNYLGKLPECLGDARPECVTAIGETVANRLVRESWPAFAAWNMRQCTRIYPRQLRIDSSNFDPRVFWDAGASMVALNWQTKDTSMQRNRALFAANGACGYVLKPEYLRVGPADGSLPQPPARTWRLKIRIISGQQLPNAFDDRSQEIVNPYVAIDVGAHNARLLSSSNSWERRIPPGAMALGASTDDDADGAAALVAATYFSRVVASNGFGPSWEEVCSFVFARPETAFVRFRVWNAESTGMDTLLGTYMIHLPNLMQGYRHIPLENESGDPVPFATLFVKLRLKPYVE